MSLDVYLNMPGEALPAGSGIFVREGGQTCEISREEWDEQFPGREPVVATRDTEDGCVYSANITHNLGRMASEAGIYRALWRPDEIGITKAHQLIEPLAVGLTLLKVDPTRFKAFNSPNGWGLYKHFVPFVEKYLEACKSYLNADVSVWR